MKRINIAAPEFAYDGEDPEGFRSGMARLGKLLGDPEADVIVRRESKVDYFGGEA